VTIPVQQVRRENPAVAVNAQAAQLCPISHACTAEFYPARLTRAGAGQGGNAQAAEERIGRPEVDADEEPAMELSRRGIQLLASGPVLPLTTCSACLIGSGFSFVIA